MLLYLTFYPNSCIIC